MRQVFINHENRLVFNTLYQMEKSFGQRILTYWFLIAKRTRLPKDIVKLIGSMIPRDYREDPIWTYLSGFFGSEIHLSIEVKNAKKYNEMYKSICDNTFHMAKRGKLGYYYKCVKFTFIQDNEDDDELKWIKIKF